MVSTTIHATVRRHLEQGTGASFRLKTYSGVYVKYGYEQLVEQALRWSAFYRRSGLEPGSRLAVILPHSLDAYASYLGAVLGGHVPAHVHFPSPRISWESYARSIGPQLAAGGFRLLVTYGELVPLLAARLEEAGAAATLVEASTVTLPPADRLALDTAASPDDVAFLQFSSGTTGLKKGVAVRHRDLLWQVETYARRLSITRADRIASWLPLYHDLGLIACFWLPILLGVPVVALSPFEWVEHPALLLDAISRRRCTLCWMPNFAYLHLCKAVALAGSTAAEKTWSLSRVRGFVNGGEPVLWPTRERFRETLAPHGVTGGQLWTIYGMAEVVLAATSGDAAHPPLVDDVDARAFAEEGIAAPAAAPGEATGVRRHLSCGVPLPGVEVTVVGPGRRPLPERHVGEIVVRSPCRVDRYLGDAPESGASDPAFGDGGAFYSGDLGYLAGGHLFVTGRRKDLLIVAGRNIYPQDVEALVDSIAGVIPGRTAALGLDDAERGTQGLVVVAETRQSSRAARDSLRAEIDAAVRAAAGVGVRDVFLAPPRWLQKSSSGKIARRANLEKYLRQAGARDAEPASPAGESLTEAGLRRVIASVLPSHAAAALARLGPRDPFLASGLVDSLTLVELLLACERALGLRLPEHELLDVDRNFHCLEDLLAWLRRLHAESAWPRERFAEIRPLPQEEALSVRRFKSAAWLEGSRDHDLLILGSSRVMHLSSRVAAEHGYRSFNFGLNWMRGEDYECVLRLVLAEGRVPLRRVIAGLDVDNFSNVAPYPEPSLADCPPLARYLGERKDGAPWMPWAEERFHGLLERQRRESARVFTFDRETGDQLFLDSRLHHTRQRTFMSRGPESYFNTIAIQLAGFTALDRRRLDAFLRFAGLCRERGIELTCYVNPLHPKLMDFVRRATTYPERRRDLERFFAAELPWLPLPDYSLPALFGGADEDFEDAGHIMPWNADVLLRRLLRPG